MNLILGKVVNNEEIHEYIPNLGKQIGETLAKPLLSSQRVINACEKLAFTLSDESIYPILESLGIEGRQAAAQVKNLRLVFSREYLQQRLLVELGETYGHVVSKTPFQLNREVKEQIYPLGVLFHIAAGNMDGLPVYSVIEGLLAGNINLLKLPSVDGGLTVMILQKLCEVEPILAEYIYVFELSSKETSSISMLMKLADAVVVWGGDDAVTAIRKITPPDTRIIEWGHKLSFAYVTKAGITKDKLKGLAHNVCMTNQLLCSSCQGIFLDTSNQTDAVEFCSAFLPIIEEVAQEYPDIPLAARAQNALQLQTRKLEDIYGHPSQIYKGKYASLIVEEDDELSLSLQFRNLWIKCLPRERIVAHLHTYKSHLQTAALLCGEAEWDSLRDMLWRAGVVRISDGENMSQSYCGASHDGDYPLRRYTRIVSAQQ